MKTTTTIKSSGEELTIIKEVTDSDNNSIIQDFDINDTLISIKAHSDKFIYWCSDWGQIRQLVELGFVKTKFYKHLMGHEDFFIV